MHRDVAWSHPCPAPCAHCDAARFSSRISLSTRINAQVAARPGCSVEAGGAAQGFDFGKLVLLHSMRMLQHKDALLMGGPGSSIGEGEVEGHQTYSF